MSVSHQFLFSPSTTLSLKWLVANIHSSHFVWESKKMISLKNYKIHREQQVIYLNSANFNSFYHSLKIIKWNMYNTPCTNHCSENDSMTKDVSLKVIECNTPDTLLSVARHIHILWYRIEGVTIKFSCSVQVLVSQFMLDDFYSSSGSFLLLGTHSL